MRQEIDNIDFKGKKITVQSENPDDPDKVAHTIIDIDGHSDFRDTRRGFIFQSGEDSKFCFGRFYDHQWLYERHVWGCC